MNKLILAVALIGLTACGSSYSSEYEGAPAMARDTSQGSILATPAGMTLYTFDKDSDGRSVCSGQCAVNWPPFMADMDAQTSDDYTLIPRDDGGMQWSYEGKPLYLFVGDKAPGDVKGDGLKGVWHVIPSDM